MSARALTSTSSHVATFASVTRRRRLAAWGFPEFFVVCQTLFPAILFLPGTQSFRLPLRVAPFGISLVALAWWFSRKHPEVRQHPAMRWLLLAISLLFLMVFHPTTNSTTAGLAQVILYLSVMAPVFWAPAMIKDAHRLRRLLLMLLICSGLNSLIGVLQVHDSATWLPAEFSTNILSDEYGLERFVFINAAGESVIRPPGLSDTPGAVCSAGMLAALLGGVFALGRTEIWKRAVALGFALLGACAVYLSQVRTALLIFAGMLLVYVAVIWFVQRETTRKALISLGIAVCIAGVGFSSAYFIGGSVITERVTSLALGSPVVVYYTTGRGEQMEESIKSLLPQYPLGAGLGRWGMMRYYFGDETNTDSPQIWAELQFPAWTLDGGIGLILFYCLALVVTARYEYRITRNATNSQIRFLAPIVVAANAGALALVFGFTPFTTQLGMQYWFLAGALHGVVQRDAFFHNGSIRTNKRRLHALGRHGSR